MAFGDSTEKDVRVALGITGADEVKAILADIMDTLRRLRSERTDVRLGLADPTLSAKLDEIKAKLDVLGAKDTSIKIKEDGFDDAILKLETLKRLKSEVSGTVDIRTRVSGLGKDAAEIAALDAAKGGGGGYRGSAVGGLFGTFGAATAGAPIIGGALAAAPEAALAGLTALLPIIGALTTFGLGAGIGGTALFGAAKIGASASSQSLAYQQQIKSLQYTVGGLGTSSAAARTRAHDLGQIAIDQKALANIQKADGGFIQIYKDVQNIGKVIKEVFGGALAGGGKNSFIHQIGEDLKPVSGMIKQLQGPLQKLFQASAPYVKAFLIIIDELAKTAIPAITAALKNFAPHLPGLERSFQIVFDVVGALIDGLAHLAGAFADLVTGGVALWKAAYPGLKATFGPIISDVMGVVHAFEAIVGAISSAIDWIGKFVAKMGSIGSGLVGGAAHFFGFSGGGIIPGYAPGHDVIPALVSPGESILTPEATRAVGAGNILRLNALSGRPTTQTAGILHAAGGFLDGGGLSMGGGTIQAGTTLININLSGVITNPDGTARQIQQALLNLKRHNGNRSLGLT
jgi:hypothetical protein